MAKPGKGLRIQKPAVNWIIQWIPWLSNLRTSLSDRAVLSWQVDPASGYEVEDVAEATTQREFGRKNPVVAVAMAL